MSAAEAPALSAWGALRLALRLLRRDWRAGELRVLAVALVVAVASVTTVAFFADRVKQALSREASQLLGADLVVVSDRPLDPGLAAQARAQGLRAIETVRFPSMTLAGSRSVLTEIKAVQAGYPLKGRIAVRPAPDAPAQRPESIPPPGSIWADERLLARLEVGIGDAVTVGQRNLRIAAVVLEDPETAVGFLNLGPRLILNRQDLDSTGLIQVGSRVTYRLGVAGEVPAVSAFRQAAQRQVGPGQRVEDVRDARPEVRTALERAEKFLGLSALLSVLLAAVAVALAARRYLRRHLDSCAIMRCLGATQGLILWLHVQQFAALGAIASAVGCVIGFAGQAVLAALLTPLVGVPLPAPGLAPVGQGFVAGFVLLLGFGIPPILALRRVPTLRVLRRDLGLPDSAGMAGYLAGAAAVCGLVLWEAQDLKVGAYVLAGALGTAAALALVTLVLMRLVMRVSRGTGFAWRFGLANLRRRPLASVTQVAAVGVGLMALTLLTITRSDLLASWQRSLPADAPNRFLVNIQPDQVGEVHAFFAQNGLPAPELYPMIRGRLTAINERRVSSNDFADDRAKRLVDREFNLSWARARRADNLIVAGRWWSESRPGAQEFSVEEGIAQTLGIGLADRLTYEIGGQVLTGTVTSLRKVEWDSFRVNFFVLAPPGMLDPYPASHVTSFHLAPERATLMDQLVKRFPNFLVIDVAAVLGQIQRIMDQVVKAVEFVFLFGLLAGVIVLVAAINASQDERVLDAAILRTLGASSAQMRAAQSAEFVAIGALAGLLAAIGASALGYVLASRVLAVPYTLNPTVWVAGLVAGTIGVLAAGLISTRSVRRTAPMEIFRRAA